MKLKVLAGAKTGTEIPLKKSKFVIGRASDCTLRAGSEAISRHHCVFLRTDSGISIRDLGSRNGTYVNDERIEKETVLADGDTLRVGPLEFVCVATADTPVAKQPDTKSADAAAHRSKKPKVKSVAEAVTRTASNGGEGSDVSEDDVSSWLLGPAPSESPSLRETQTFRLDETQAAGKLKADAEEAPSESEEDSAVVAEDETDKHGKKKPGKLPKMPPQNQSKDSKEAAEQILRQMARRR